MNNQTTNLGSIAKKTSSFPKSVIWIGIIVVLGLWVMGVYNGLIRARQGVDTSWGQVETDYQRRSDLVGQLVSTVKGVANFEQSTLTQVIEARSKATSVTVNANDAESFKNFQAAQGQLQGSLSRLLAVAESYPQLRATEAFITLQSQIEGTENRIAVARKDYNTAVGSYNIYTQTFPRTIIARLFGFTPRELFAASEGAEVAPEIDFGTFDGGQSGGAAGGTYPTGSPEGQNPGPNAAAE
jgi:LemA protein